VKVLWIAKRFQSGHDVLRERFGRYYHLPRAVAGAGHPVHLALLNYRSFENPTATETPLTLQSVPPLFRRLTQIVHSVRPDLIVGSSDPVCCLWAQKLALKYRIGLSWDLHDDYSTYAWAHWPGLIDRFNGAADSASRISCVTPTLARTLKVETTFLLPNGADPELFYRRENAGEKKSRVGYFGALHPNRGLDVLVRAWPKVKRRHPSAELLLGGKRHRRFKLPEVDGIRYLGHLPGTQIPALLSTLAVALVFFKANRFGLSAYPYKLAEAEAGGVPVLGPSLGSFGERYAGHPSRCFDPESADDIADKISRALESPLAPLFQPHSWSSLAERWLGENLR